MIKRDDLRKKPSLWLVIILVLISAYSLMPVGVHFAEPKEEWEWYLFTIGYPGLLIVIGILIGVELLPLNVAFYAETIAKTPVVINVIILLFLAAIIGRRSYYHLILSCFVLLVMTASATACFWLGLWYF